MGLSPAGFIMNITMKRAITIISTAIMKMVAMPIYGAASIRMIRPTAVKDKSRRNEARTMESVANTRQPETIAIAESTRKVRSISPIAAAPRRRRPA